MQSPETDSGFSFWNRVRVSSKLTLSSLTGPRPRNSAWNEAVRLESRESQRSHGLYERSRCDSIVLPSTGSVHGTNRIPPNLYMPWETDVNQRKPSVVCATAKMPAGTEPPCVRHAVCMYWVSRLLGSSATAWDAESNTQAKHEPSAAAMAPRAQLKRIGSSRREAMFAETTHNIRYDDLRRKFTLAYLSCKDSNGRSAIRSLLSAA